MPRFIADDLVIAARGLSRAVDRLKFGRPVIHVYNPLNYAWQAHEGYLRKYGDGRKRVLFLGLNPGPFGMVQTGVPFGEVNAVRGWMEIEAPISKPRAEPSGGRFCLPALRSQRAAALGLVWPTLWHGPKVFHRSFRRQLLSPGVLRS